MMKNILSSAKFICLCSLITVIYNYLFVSKVIESSNLWIGVLFIVTLFLLFVIAYSLLLQKYVTKVLLAFFIIANTGALYFMQTYNVAIDKIMMINVFQTDKAEVEALFSWKMLLFVILGVLLPLWLLLKVKIRYGNFKQELWLRIKMVLSCGLLIILLLLPFISKIDTFLEERKHLLYFMMPSNYIGSTIDALKVMNKHNNLQPLNKKAQLNKYWQNNGRKNLFVIVVGESARAASFSLNGYERATNKPLNPFVKDMMVFKHTKACGTSTAIAVPCMFSPYGQKDFVAGSASYIENVLDVLAYNGYKAVWRENNSSCKGNCSRIETEIFCQDNSCMDTLMQDNLVEKINSINDNMVIVLHQYGSHGPDYFLRYPQEFEIYKPVCKDIELKNCSYDEIRNAYDNSIVYNSYIMAKMLKELSALKDKYNVVVLYTSDHGESLGEDGVYLHAAVYKYAPHYQTEVPFWIWMPEETRRSMNYDKDCLLSQARKQISHDNLFHSLLGLAGLSIDAYDESLDVFAPCR